MGQANGILGVHRKTEGKKKTIGQKISQGTLFLTVVSTLIACAVGLFGIAVTNRSVQNMYRNNMLPVKTLYELSNDLSSIRVDARNLLLDNGDASTIISDINTQVKGLQNEENAYEANLSSAEERANNTALKKAVTNYVNTMDQLVQEYESGDKSGALASLNQQSSKSVLSAVEKAYTLNVSESQQSDQTSVIVFYSIIAVLVLVVVGVIFSALRKSRRFGKQISDPLVQMSKAAASIADGDLSVDIDIHTGDETEQLAEAFKQIIRTLRLMKTDVQSLAASAVKGELEKRVDEQNHHGAYGQIIAGVNSMMDAVKAPLDVAFGFIRNLSNGVRQPDIENAYQGAYATLTSNLNEVKHALDIMLDEAGKLGEAGKRGALEVRGNESKLKGVYADTIRSFNEAFEGLQRPMDDVINRLDGIAGGQLNMTTENPYQGYPARLVENLNVMYGALASMVTESRKIAQHAQEGDFSIRGNTEKLHGSQVEVVQGFNNTLDFIVKPLDELRTVLRAMSKHNFTLEVSTDYKGVMKELAEDVSALREDYLYTSSTYRHLADGDISDLEFVKQRGKLSENDDLTEDFLRAFQAIQDLITESNEMVMAVRVGNLGKRVDETRFMGSFKEIIHGLNGTMEAVSGPINETVQALGRLADGDLTVQITTEYSGQYDEIVQSINLTVASLNELLLNISIAAEEVSVGASQISDSSQSLSQGAAEQASSVEELTASLSEIAEKTKENAEKSANTSSITRNEQGQVGESNEKMKQMLNAMTEINTASSSISKIIKVIDDIAFQTNILALNAAVEAARAGQYGKGFAVVAEEVRNLAAKSAQAAENTTDLIAGSVEKAQSGTQIANQTAETLNRISESVRQATGLVDEISAASNEQSTAITQISQGISQVSTVVQTNSATAEECAASSEELSGQADTLKQLIGQFKIAGK